MREYLEANGAPATAEQLHHPVLNNYGHFTAMQVRGGCVRGLDLHLDRLSAATRELFDADLDPGVVRRYLRHALAGTPDAAVRVYVYWPGEPMVLVAVRPPDVVPAEAVRLMSVPYLRPVPHVKHVGGFGQRYVAAQAAERGFDDALLTAPDGTVAETALANIGFLRGSTVVWPDAPALAGSTKQLLDKQLADRGSPTLREPVRLADVGSFDGAFVTSSVSVRAVSRVDDTVIPGSPDVDTVRALFAEVPWDDLAS